MESKECLTKRRSIRKYKDTPVSKDVLNEVVRVASYAPSWKHSQISRYLVLEGEKKQAIAEQCVPDHNCQIIQSAPTLVVVTAIKARSGFERDGSFSTKKEDRWQNFDAGIATQTFCLAAYEEGLGTVIMGIFDEDKVRDLAQVPENQDIMALVAIGYPDEEPTAPKRKAVEDLVTYL